MSPASQNPSPNKPLTSPLAPAATRPPPAAARTLPKTQPLNPAEAEAANQAPSALVARPATAPKNQPIRSNSQAAEPSNNKRKKLSSGFFILLLVISIMLVAMLYLFGVRPRLKAKTDLDQEQKLSTQRTVIFATARMAATKTELPLPGTVEAFQQASIYARTDGYVKKWAVDIGDIVHEGDILAELDTPEIDQQLSQAKAQVEQNKASVAIAQTAADRWNNMVAQHAVSQEEADEKTATLSISKANLDAAQANVARLTDQQNFKEIKAPFTGTITYRHIDVGNLISSGNGTGAEIYRIAQTDPLRVYVDVPQAETTAIHVGVQANIRVPAYPNRVFHGEVVRDAGALDNVTRALRTEIHVANPDGALLPGTFAEVRLQIVNSTPAILIPANTLVVNSAGTSVLIVVPNDQGQDVVRTVPVHVGRDLGTDVEILDGVKDHDRLVTNPPPDLTDGTPVTAKELPKAAAPPPPLTVQPKA